MEILFGRITVTEAQQMGLDYADMFTPGDISGDLYDYKLEMKCIDTFTIRDSLGRYVPFNYSQLDEVIRALQELKNSTAPYVLGVTTSRDILQEMKIEC